MSLPHQPDISAYDDLLKLTILAGYPKAVLDAIAANQADAALIAHTERVKLEQVFTGTTGLEGFLDTQAGSAQTTGIRTEINAINIDATASPFADPEKTQTKESFEKLARHVREAIVNLTTRHAPPLAPKKAPIDSADFISRYLKLTPADIDKHPAAKALADKVADYAAAHPDFRDIEEFFENPDTLIANTKADLEKEREVLLDELTETKGKLKVKIALLNKSTAATKGAAPGPTVDYDALARDISGLEKKERQKTQEIENKKNEINQISAKNLGARRKNMTHKEKLDNLILFFKAKEAIRRNEEIDYEEVVNESAKALEKAEEEHLAKVSVPVGKWQEFFDKWNPDLDSTLRTVAQTNKTLKEIPLDYIGKLPEVIEDDGVFEWIKNIPVALEEKPYAKITDTDEKGKKQEEDRTKKRFEVYLPVLSAHVNEMLNVGGRAKLNKESLEKTKKLAIQLGKIERAHQIERGKLAPGGKPIDKMLAYSKVQSEVDAQKGDKKTLEEAVDNGFLKKIGKTVKKTVLGTTFVGATILGSPAIATLGVGGLLALLYRAKGDKTPAEIKNDKIKSNLLAIGSALTAGGIYWTGVSAAPVLAVAAGAWGIKYGYEKVEDRLKKWAEKTKKVAKGFI